MELYRTHIKPPTPVLTEKNLPDQKGKIFIVTGASSGVGEKLTQILYQHNAKIYLATRSAEKTTQAIERIKTAVPSSEGQLVHLSLDLADLTTIKNSADEFLAAETHLDVLWLNAGVMIPLKGSKTTQGFELQQGTNNLGHFLFTRYLHPILARSASKAPKDSVRIVWVSSSAAEFAPNPPVDLNNMDYHKDESAATKYARSKAGNVLHAVEFGRRTKGEGIISVSLNPGNLKTELQRHTPAIGTMIVNLLLHPAIYGAYTELFAGLSSDVTEEKNGAWIQPWGRFAKIRTELADEELGKKYWEWTEDQLKQY